MRKALSGRVERLEQQSNQGFDAIIPVSSDEDAEACRAWWQKENPGVPDSRLLLIVTGVPRGYAEPWDREAA
jgi:hypothetical protein